MNDKWIKIREIAPQILTIAFVMLVIFSLSTKSQPASILQSIERSATSEPPKSVEVKQPEEELWEPVEKVPDNIYAYYPLAVGNSWEYVGQQEAWQGSGEDGQVIIKPYDHIITIKAIRKNKENVYEIEREGCNGKNDDYNQGECWSSTFYLARNNICYSSDCSELELSFPLPEDQVLMDESYKERMTTVDDKRYVNFVHKKQKNIVLGKEVNNCFPIEYRTLPDESIDTFCYGIGYVGSRYKHHGPIDDREDKLVKINF